MCGQDRGLPELLHTDPDGGNVPASAWAGITATLRSSGRTIHNLLKLAVPIFYKCTCSVTSNPKHADYLRSVTLFIMDEASMVPFHVLNALDITDNIYVDVERYYTAECFLGWQVFLTGGDFRQVLPVVPRKPRTVIVENYIKSSSFLPLFSVVKLKKNMRAAEEADFAHGYSS